MTFWGYVLAGLAAIFTFGLLIFIHEFGHFITAKMSKVKVNEFALGMGPAIFKFTRGDTQYSLRAFPIGGYCSMEGEDENNDSEGSFNKAPVWNRILIVAAGAIMNLLLGFVVLTSLIGSEDAIISKTVSVFYEDAVTQQSGLEIGDTFYSINGRRLYVANDIIYEMRYAENGIADVVVIRNGEKVELNDFQFNSTLNDDGTWSIKVDFAVLPIEPTFGSVLKEAGLETASTIRLIVASVIDLIAGRVSAKSITGAVGIVVIIGQASAQGLKTLLNLLAFLSINLGIMNILPLPALDGGRLMFLLFEAVTGKRLNPKYEGIVHTIGFVLLLLLLLFVTYNDITRLIL